MNSNSSFWKGSGVRLASDQTYDLTVVTVCWNVLPELKETVDSVLKQKRKGKISIEHIIVDGASHDGTTEWLKQAEKDGRIEAYVSEPDNGIYDAMNKGIAMARGKVISFMNAGDGYSDEDISVCITPILSGKVSSVLANADMLSENGTFEFVKRPEPSLAYYSIMGCHQSYFFDTQICRELGGYDVASFRILGDLDLANKFLKMHGMPQFVDISACFFKMGGASNNCWSSARSEYIEIHRRSWPELLQRCRRNRKYAAMLMSLLVGHCRVLGKMTEDEVNKNALAHEALSEMLQNLPPSILIPVKRGLLRIAQSVAFGCYPKNVKLRVLDVCDYVCSVSFNNQYIFWGPKLSLFLHPVRLLKRLRSKWGS